MPGAIRSATARARPNRRHPLRPAAPLPRLSRRRGVVRGVAYEHVRARAVFGRSGCLLRRRGDQTPVAGDRRRAENPRTRATACSRRAAGEAVLVGRDLAHEDIGDRRRAETFLGQVGRSRNEGDVAAAVGDDRARRSRRRRARTRTPSVVVRLTCLASERKRGSRIEHVREAVVVRCAQRLSASDCEGEARGPSLEMEGSKEWPVATGAPRDAAHERRGPGRPSRR